MNYTPENSTKEKSLVNYEIDRKKLTRKTFNNICKLALGGGFFLFSIPITSIQVTRYLSEQNNYDPETLVGTGVATLVGLYLTGKGTYDSYNSIKDLGELELKLKNQSTNESQEN
jgi:hypothetical protein